MDLDSGILDLGIKVALAAIKKKSALRGAL
jgi:hypothetical protein